MATLQTLSQKVQRKGYKIHHYESTVQFSFIIQDKDEKHIGAWHETSILKRVLAKAEITEKLEQILNN